MQAFSDWERDQRGIAVNPATLPAECPCGSTFFEETKVFQIQRHHNVILGQPVPVVSQDYVFYRCIKCKELLEPNLAINNRDTVARLYDDLRSLLSDEDDNVQDPEPKPIPFAGDK